MLCFFSIALHQLQAKVRSAPTMESIHVQGIQYVSTNTIHVSNSSNTFTDRFTHIMYDIHITTLYAVLVLYCNAHIILNTKSIICRTSLILRTAFMAMRRFIDDAFAVIIDMPTKHRVMTLRDDLVFFIYLYQRYLYPTDKTRANEFGR